MLRVSDAQGPSPPRSPLEPVRECNEFANTSGARRLDGGIVSTDAEAEADTSDSSSTGSSASDSGFGEELGSAAGLFFDAARMADALAGATAPGPGRVLCATELGLICARRGEGYPTVRRDILLRPTVLLDSAGETLDRTA
jgi:hypothetical protein